MTPESETGDLNIHRHKRHHHRPGPVCHELNSSKKQSAASSAGKKGGHPGPLVQNVVGSSASSDIELELQLKRIKQQAVAVTLTAPKNLTVFYHGKSGYSKAREFIEEHPGAKSIDDILNGRAWFDELVRLTPQIYEKVERIWWILSAKLAEAAEGDVWVFGGDTYSGGHDLESAIDWKDFRSRHGDHTLMSTVFDMVESPILLASEKVETVYYNMKPYE